MKLGSPPSMKKTDYNPRPLWGERVTAEGGRVRGSSELFSMTVARKPIPHRGSAVTQ